MKVLDENGFAGFLYLQGLFGPKGNTKEAKKLRTKDKTPPIGAGISAQNRALAEQLEEQAVAIYIQTGLSQEDAEEAAAAALPALLKQAGVADSVIKAITNEAAVTSAARLRLLQRLMPHLLTHRDKLLPSSLRSRLMHSISQPA